MFIFNLAFQPESLPEASMDQGYIRKIRYANVLECRRASIPRVKQFLMPELAFEYPPFCVHLYLSL